jgi:hypothetical protein
MLASVVSAARDLTSPARPGGSQLTCYLGLYSSSTSKMRVWRAGRGSFAGIFARERGRSEAGPERAFHAQTAR